MKLTATCPTCNAELELEDVAPGTVVECPSCNHALTAPEPPRASVRVAAPRPEAIAAPAAPATPKHIRATVQLTDKKWKVLALLGFLMIAGGIVAWIGSPDDPGAGVTLLVLGILFRIIARCGKWWTND